MGSGNHTYGQQLRGEGPGTFLSAASAMPLSAHPLFTGNKKTPVDLTCQIADLTAVPDKGKLTLTARLLDGPKAVGIVAYNDAQDVPSDYDALGWTSPVAADGGFRFVIEDLRPVAYELRLSAIGETGNQRTFTYRYAVSTEGLPDVGPLLNAQWMHKAIEAFRARDSGRLAEIAAEAGLQNPANAGLVRQVELMQKLLSPSEVRDVSSLPGEVASVRLADVKMESMTVGWGRPLRNQVLPEGDGGILLEVGGTVFESGLYAHAPARHAVRLNRGWRNLTMKIGLQDGHAGSVVFVVKGDDKELFRSGPVRKHTALTQSVSIAGVDLLELIVEDAGDGNGGDWGVWLDPTLQR